MSNFSKVGTFMKTFGQEVKTKPSFSTDKINKLRLELCLLYTSDALIIALEILPSINLSLAWTIAADLLIIAIDLIIEILTKIFPILKNLLDLWVDAPQYLSFGTFILPILSNSFLNFID